jgi:hypothetical protein
VMVTGVQTCALPIFHASTILTLEKKPLVTFGQEASGSQDRSGRFGESRRSYPTTNQTTNPRSSNP